MANNKALFNHYNPLPCMDNIWYAFGLLSHFIFMVKITLDVKFELS